MEENELSFEDLGMGTPREGWLIHFKIDAFTFMLEHAAVWCTFHEGRKWIGELYFSKDDFPMRKLLHRSIVVFKVTKSDLALRPPDDFEIEAKTQGILVQRFPKRHNRWYLEFVKRIEEYPPNFERVSAGQECAFQLISIKSSISIDMEKYRSKFSEVLDYYGGRKVREEWKERVFKELKEVSETLGVFFKCPKTGEPGRLRLRKDTRTGTLTFEIIVMKDGKKHTCYSSVNFPTAEITTEQPIDRRKKPK